MTRLLVPFVLYLGSFTLYTNFSDGLVNLDIYKTERLLFTFIWLLNIGVLVTLSAYFMALEIFQIKNIGREYLKDIWNYIDLIPPIVVWIIVILNLGMWETPVE
jgi:Polycystin cation channel